MAINTGEGLRDFQNCLVPDKRLTPQGMVDSMRSWCKNGSRVNGGVTSAMALNYFMRALYKHCNSGRTPFIRHVIDTSGLRFMYQELFFFVMPYMRSEETAELAEHEYGLNEHAGEVRAFDGNRSSFPYRQSSSAFSDDREGRRSGNTPMGQVP